MNKTLQTSIDIETQNQARSDLAYSLVADAYPIVASAYNLGEKAYLGGASLQGEQAHTIKTDEHNFFQIMTKTGGR